MGNSTHWKIRIEKTSGKVEGYQDWGTNWILLKVVIQYSILEGESGRRYPR